MALILVSLVPTILQNLHFTNLPHRQRRPQHSLLLLLRFLPSHHNVRGQNPHLLHQCCSTMPPPRRLHPARRNAKHGFRLCPILQQRRLQCWTIWLRRQLQSMELRPLCQGFWAKTVYWRTRLLSLRWVWVCESDYYDQRCR